MLEAQCLKITLINGFAIDDYLMSLENSRILGGSFYTVKSHNLEEPQRIYKGSKEFAKAKYETFWVFFKHCLRGVMAKIDNKSHGICPSAAKRREPSSTNITAAALNHRTLSKL